MPFYEHACQRCGGGTEAIIGHSVADGICPGCHQIADLERQLSEERQRREPLRIVAAVHDLRRGWYARIGCACCDHVHAVGPSNSEDDARELARQWIASRPITSTTEGL